MNFNIWINDTQAIDFLERSGYNIVTVRRLLKRFGYKNEKDILEKLSVTKSFLNEKLAYKDEDEFNDLCIRFSVIVEYLKQEDKNKYYHRDSYLLCVSKNSTTGEFTFGGRESNSSYHYKAKHRFDTYVRKLIKNNTGINIYTGEYE